jgi:hypothetical protein
LSYVRTTPPGRGSDPIARPILVSVNFTAQYQTVHLNLAAAGVGNHYTWSHLDAPVQFGPAYTASTLTLPPYAALITGIQ